MILHRPVAKLRHVLERFGAMEERLVDLQARLQELQQVVADGQHRSEQAAAGRFEELRDSVHLAARRSGPTRRPTRALFLVHHIEAWDSYHDLVRAMRNAADFEPIVVSIPRRFPGADGFSYEEEIHRGLDARGVPHLRLPAHGAGEALRLIKAIDPDLVFRQSQWDVDVPDDLATHRLTFTRLCLIPYETMNLVENVPGPGGVNTAVDNPLHQAAWAVFCANDLMFDMARTDGVRAGDRFRVTGHPKADRLRAAAPSWPIDGRPSGQRRRRIVWSAHHSIGTTWSNFGAFPAMAEDMLAWATEDQDTEFVFMPHPALLTIVHSPESPVSPDRLVDWRAAWEALPNTAVFTDGDYAPLLVASDMLITDGLSMLVEYQLIERPIVYVERPDHRPFTPIGEMVRRGTHPVRTVAEARTVANPFLAGQPDPLRLQQARNVERLFGQESSVPRILDTLREMLAAERSDPVARPRDPAPLAGADQTAVLGRGRSQRWSDWLDEESQTSAG
ncbi:hypothetical protein [Geodermatophilus ruber]|uniref:CDP-Glycerol:Poly(Glycerophosphate) glycerophosphotransferase n=1 Tax=Geodermatophilus ruber TaxID=504800 RepID=A0A1I4LQD9_9ACTN|nr:hypothetical protein [Geodermatophilus ruber]SFL93242.1 hypothetical protein SAMN04488085_12327 [Geodermatophilus ruber]